MVEIRRAGPVHGFLFSRLKRAAVSGRVWFLDVFDPSAAAPEPRAPRALKRATAFFRRFPGRALAVRWTPDCRQPDEGARALQRGIERLAARRIPVALEVVPRIETRLGVTDTFLHATLDTLLGIQHHLLVLAIGALARSPALWPEAMRIAELLEVQVQAELDDAEKLAPPGLARRPSLDAAGTRLRTAEAARVRSRYDLGALNLALEPQKAAQPCRGGRRATPRPDLRIRAEPRPTEYLVFPGSPLTFGRYRENEAYLDALRFFREPRPATAFLRRFSGAEAAETRACIDIFVENGVLLRS